jgi:electron transfer flavoprotein alpha subunit
VAKIWVYAELDQGKLASTSLELMTKARELGDVEAIALGAGAKAAAAALGKYGAKVVHVNEDAAFDDYIACSKKKSPTSCSSASRLTHERSRDALQRGWVSV